MGRKKCNKHKDHSDADSESRAKSHAQEGHEEQESEKDDRAKELTRPALRAPQEARVSRARKGDERERAKAQVKNSVYKIINLHDNVPSKM